jgi:DNA-binding response OmpR family regulator
MPDPKRSIEHNASVPKIQSQGSRTAGRITEGEDIAQTTALPTRVLGNENTDSRILVVDDDPSVLCLVVTVLSRNGYRVDSAEDGIGGWNALSAKRFDLLITDYSMPNLNGIELLRMVWSSPVRVPAILMSASMPQDVGEIIDLVAPGGALHKPFAIRELLFKVGTILDLERSRTGDAASECQNGIETASRRERKLIELAARSRLSDLAGQILTHESNIGCREEGGAPVIFKVCDNFRGALKPLTGENGFRTILRRALMLSRSEVPWFANVIISPKGYFDGLRRAETGLAETEVIRGETVLIAHLLGLLFTFIGDELTRNLLQDLWPRVQPLPSKIFT